MNKRTIIAEMLSLANELDDANYIEEADHLTQLAGIYQSIKPYIQGEEDINPPDPNEDTIEKKALEIMQEQFPEGDFPDIIPDDIWEQARLAVIDEMENHNTEFEPEMREENLHGL